MNFKIENEKILVNNIEGYFRTKEQRVNIYIYHNVDGPNGYPIHFVIAGIVRKPATQEQIIDSIKNYISNLPKNSTLIIK